MDYPTHITSRRRLLSKLALASGMGLLAGSLPQAAGAIGAEPNSRTFVLVHGAWHGGWCWARVARLLRAAGHDVYAPSLTGLGDRSHLLAPGIDSQLHVQDVANLLEYEDLSSVVLVGH